jgi:hypothetical protein
LVLLSPSPRCCHCSAKPAVLHCSGANPTASLLPAPSSCLCLAASHHEPLVERAFSVVRKLQFHCQAWVGVGRRQVSHPPRCSRTASLRPHTALRPRARRQGCKQPWAYPEHWCSSAWAMMPAEAELAEKGAANSCAGVAPSCSSQAPGYHLLGLSQVEA